ncbi:NADPH:quinone reductase [Agromyces aurantiacus]|uniref:NADPH:quinone reductase n=1 Tax=Agromyces aurantiacus TaxID=165814 RepID=A0ABV9R9V5_9MICO|nr:NADPH:quinone reductase [Agromyces aurantiacus]MBM7503627.1 NADPH2:quinone reductase [Agromyces aurantiacus]
MRAIVYRRPGDSSVLEASEREVAEPGPCEIRVRVVVSGVNPTDWKARRGTGTSAGSAAETVPNQDGAGVVEAVGPDVTEFAVGDRVWLAVSAWRRPGSGTAQEQTVTLVDRAFPLPDGVSFDVGASLGVPAVTAHRALTVAEGGPDRLRPGALEGVNVLVQGGAGAVGHAAIQLARWAGANVIATVSSPRKAALAEAAGAHHVVNRHDPDAAEQVRAIVPEGVDVVVEVAAGANAEFDQAVTHERSTIAAYGNDGGMPLAIDFGRALSLNLRYQFVLIYTMGTAAWEAAGAAVTEAARDGVLAVGEAAGLPLHRFPLAETAAAHDAVEAGAVGKVLIDVAGA